MNHGPEVQQSHHTLSHLQRNFPFLLEKYNVSPSYYDNVLHSRNLFLRTYHSNRYRSALKELIQNLTLNHQPLVLDLGCNGGTFIRLMLKTLKSEVVGVDPSSPHIAYANIKLKDDLCSFVKCVGENPPFRSDAFDVVTSLEVLEHSFSPKNFVDEIHRVLRPNGLLVLTVPNEGSPIYKVLWGFWKYLGAGRVWGKLHLNRFNRKKLMNLLKRFKFLKERMINLTMLILIVAKK
ncbi:MAG: class I SAM-dependent methyltransferase [Nitrososphaerota archaeon]